MFLKILEVNFFLKKSEAMNVFKILEPVNVLIFQEQLMFLKFSKAINVFKIFSSN